MTDTLHLYNGSQMKYSIVTVSVILFQLISTSSRVLLGDVNGDEDCSGSVHLQGKNDVHIYTHSVPRLNYAVEKVVNEGTCCWKLYRRYSYKGRHIYVKRFGAAGITTLKVRSLEKINCKTLSEENTKHQEQKISDPTEIVENGFLNNIEKRKNSDTSELPDRTLAKYESTTKVNDQIFDVLEKSMSSEKEKKYGIEENTESSAVNKVSNFNVSEISENIYKATTENDTVLFQYVNVNLGPRKVPHTENRNQEDEDFVSSKIKVYTLTNNQSHSETSRKVVQTPKASYAGGKINGFNYENQNVSSTTPDISSHEDMPVHTDELWSPDLELQIKNSIVNDDVHNFEKGDMINNSSNNHQNSKLKQSHKKNETTFAFQGNKIIQEPLNMNQKDSLEWNFNKSENLEKPMEAADQNEHLTATSGNKLVVKSNIIQSIEYLTLIHRESAEKNVSKHSSNKIPISTEFSLDFNNADVKSLQNNNLLSKEELNHSNSDEKLSNYTEFSFNNNITDLKPLKEKSSVSKEYSKRVHNKDNISLPTNIPSNNDANDSSKFDGNISLFIADKMKSEIKDKMTSKTESVQGNNTDDALALKISSSKSTEDTKGGSRNKKYDSITNEQLLKLNKSSITYDSKKYDSNENSSPDKDIFPFTTNIDIQELKSDIPISTENSKRANKYDKISHVKEMNANTTDPIPSKSIKSITTEGYIFKKFTSAKRNLLKNNITRLPKSNRSVLTKGTRNIKTMFTEESLPDNNIIDSQHMKGDESVSKSEKQPNTVFSNKSFQLMLQNNVRNKNSTVSLDSSKKFLYEGQMSEVRKQYQNSSNKRPSSNFVVPKIKDIGNKSVTTDEMFTPDKQAVANKLRNHSAYNESDFSMLPLSGDEIIRRNIDMLEGPDNSFNESILLHEKEMQINEDDDNNKGKEKISDPSKFLRQKIEHLKIENDQSSTRLQRILNRKSKFQQLMEEQNQDVDKKIKFMIENFEIESDIQAPKNISEVTIIAQLQTEKNIEDTHTHEQGTKTRFDGEQLNNDGEQSQQLDEVVETNLKKPTDRESLSVESLKHTIQNTKHMKDTEQKTFSSDYLEDRIDNEEFATKSKSEKISKLKYKEASNFPSLDHYTNDIKTSIDPPRSADNSPEINVTVKVSVINGNDLTLTKTYENPILSRIVINTHSPVIHDKNNNSKLLHVPETSDKSNIQFLMGTKSILILPNVSNLTFKEEPRVARFGNYIPKEVSDNKSSKSIRERIQERKINYHAAFEKTSKIKTIGTNKPNEIITETQNIDSSIEMPRIQKIPQEIIDSKDPSNEKRANAPYSAYIVRPKEQSNQADSLITLESESLSAVGHYRIISDIPNDLDNQEETGESELSELEDEEYYYNDYHGEHSFECKYLKNEKIHLMNLISDFHHSYDDNDDYIVKLPNDVKILNQVKVNDKDIKDDLIRESLFMAVIQNDANICCANISKYLILFAISLIVC